MEKHSFSCEHISSKDNPGIKLYTKLSASKKERYKYKLFVIEGARLVFDAVKSGADIRHMYFTESAFEKYALEIQNIKSQRVRINMISGELGKYISQTENTQGIFAVCGFYDNIRVKQKLKEKGRYAVLHNLQDPGNCGMIIRTADALGLDGVIFVKSCDVYSPKTLRATMGSVFRIPVFRDIDEEELFSELERCHIEAIGAVVDASAGDLKECSFKNGGAVFIGNEGNGLCREIIQRCQSLVTIKMRGNTESLNAAMAAGIIMWELMRGE